MKRAVLKVPRAELNMLGAPLPGDENRPYDSRGRRRGGQSRTSVVLKDAILYAAQCVGEDGKGLDGLVGYLKQIARTDPRTYASLLARVIPLQVTSTTTQEVTYRSIDEVRAELAARGIPIDRIYH
jgi:hypothetical protein